METTAHKWFGHTMAILLLMEFWLAIGNVTSLIPYIENAEGVLSSCERLFDTDMKSWPTRVNSFLNPLSTRALLGKQGKHCFQLYSFSQLFLSLLWPDIMFMFILSCAYTSPLFLSTQLGMQFTFWPFFHGKADYSRTWGSASLRYSFWSKSHGIKIFNAQSVRINRKDKEKDVYDPMMCFLLSSYNAVAIVSQSVQKLDQDLMKHIFEKRKISVLEWNP